MGINRFLSSPPSPVLDFPPKRFIATASVECASVDIEPSDIAPVVKRFTISLADSTSSIGIDFVCLNSKSPRSVLCFFVWLLINSAYSL